MVPLKTFLLGVFAVTILALEVCYCSRFFVGFLKNKLATKSMTIYIVNPSHKSSSFSVRFHESMATDSSLTVQAMNSVPVGFSPVFEAVEGVSRRGILIESQHELVIIGINRVTYSTYTYMESFLGIPEESLGLSYFAVTALDRAEILIVAGYAGTLITVKVNGTLTHEGRTYNKGESFTSILNEFDTLLLLGKTTNNPLTGTHITSNKVISVYSGNEYVSIGSSNHMVQQLVPVKAWRSLYVIVPVTGTTYYLTFVAAYPNTEVLVTCVNQPRTDFNLQFAGSSITRYYQNATCDIFSDQPVSVTMLVESNDFDPVMIRIPPLHILSKKTVFLVEPDDIVAELVLASIGESTIYLDGFKLALKPISGTLYNFLKIHVNIGVHTITCDEGCQISAYIHGHHGMEATGYPINTAAFGDEQTTLANVPLTIENDGTGTGASDTLSQTTTTPSMNASSGPPTLTNHTSTAQTETGNTTTTRTNATTVTDAMKNSGTDSLQTTSSYMGENSTESSAPRTTSSYIGENSTESSTPTVTTQRQSANTTTNALNQTCTCNSCPTTNYSNEELVNLVTELRQKLLVKKRTTTNHIRTLTSAPDHRTSSKVVGYIAGTILVTLAVGLLIIDLPNLWNMLNTMKDNLLCK